MKINRTLGAVLMALLPCTVAVALPEVDSTGLPHSTLREIAQKAVLNNPEVQSRWHNFKAAVEEQEFARGGFRPRVDLTAGTGRESLKQPPTTDTGSYGRNNYVLSLNQMLFDGFATRNEVKRLGKARVVRYYELLDASENIALEAGRAYLDVLRFRFLLNLAEDNYVQHRATYEQLLRRTQSGVGRRVDLEQAASRLALAEVNLTTETANLHDVTARYLRLVNEQPPTVAFAPGMLSRAYPASQKAALEKLAQRNPALWAAQENIEAAQEELAAKRAPFYPRVDFRARTDHGSNYQALNGERVNNVAEVVMTYNLFNGGSDQARVRQYAEKKHVATDLRDKACRDTRQTLSIAYNDVKRLREQAAFVASQVDLLEKTRDAYRDQYNVGQRTLLDLLDTENELLAARRSAINADVDLSLAYLRTYAGMGTLLEFLGLKKLEVEEIKPDEFSVADLSELCPADAVPGVVTDRGVLNARAMAMLDNPAPGAAAALAPLPAPAPAPAADNGPRKTLDSWAAAWMRKDIEAYRGFYAESFVPDGGLSRSQWEKVRQARIAPRNAITLELSDIVVSQPAADKAVVRFRQTYRSNAFSDTVEKSLEMIKVGDGWLITRETSVPCEGNTVGGCTPDRRNKAVRQSDAGKDQ